MASPPVTVQSFMQTLKTKHESTLGIKFFQVGKEPSHKHRTLKENKGLKEVCFLTD